MTRKDEVSETKRPLCERSTLSMRCCLSPCGRVAGHDGDCEPVHEYSCAPTPEPAQERREHEKCHRLVCKAQPGFWPDGKGSCERCEDGIGACTCVRATGDDLPPWAQPPIPAPVTTREGEIERLQAEYDRLTLEAAARPVWRCYHCAATFRAKDLVAAREHFGLNDETTPKCFLDLRGDNARLTRELAEMTEHADYLERELMLEKAAMAKSAELKEAWTRIFQPVKDAEAEIRRNNASTATSPTDDKEDIQ